MKLISLYVENFGGLSRYELNFDKDLTVVNQPNGFGKTTLAEFIRAMLYGFPRKVKTLEKSRRQKYAPWNGGQYGGNLVFEQDGRSYRIERTFGATPKGDTFLLIDLATNKQTLRFSEELGTELFGLDADSFERSTYLPQLTQEGPLATASIQAKLTDLVEDSSDVRNFDKTMTALRTARSALMPYRGSGGAVAEAAGKISQLQLQLDTALLQQTQLTAAQKEATQSEEALEQAQAALEQLRQELAEASEKAAVEAQQRQYARLQERHSQAAAQTQQYRHRYPLGFPTAQELTDAEMYADRLAVLSAQPAGTYPEQELLQESVRFQGRIPTKSELDQCRLKCGEYEHLQTELQNVRLATAELSAAEREQPKVQPHTGLLVAAVLLLTVGAAAAVAGALLYLQAALYGSVSFAIGAGLIVAGTVLMLCRRKKRRAAEQACIDRKRSLDARQETFRRKFSALRQESEASSAWIRDFLADFGIEVPPQHYLAGLTELEHHVARYEQLKVQEIQRQTRCAQQQAEQEACRRALEERLSRYGLKASQDVRAQLRQLRDDIRAAQAAQLLKQQLAEQITAMEQEWGDALFAEFSAADPQKLKSQEQRLRQTVTELTDRLLRQHRQVQQLREKVGEIPLLREELEREQQKKAQAQEKVRILDATMAFLQQARENLSTSYLDTIRSHFGRYLAQLEGTQGERYFIDAELGIRLERNGQARELAYFSAGQTDLVMLCMRLALVDALFRNQETFVILDDPFVNLDDAHTVQALRLLRKLSARRQILYLTCHSSRTLYN